MGNKHTQHNLSRGFLTELKQKICQPNAKLGFQITGPHRYFRSCHVVWDTGKGEGVEGQDPFTQQVVRQAAKVRLQDGAA